MFAVIPIGHNKAIYKQPKLTIALIAVCTLVQVVRTIMHFAGMTGGMGEIHPNDPISLLAYYPVDGLSLGLFTHQFAHGGYLHLVGNMIFLWFTGANMEYRWGAAVWGAVYLVGGAAAALAYTLLHPTSAIPLVGASGAVATAMGAFLACHYKTRIKCWYFYFLFFRFKSGTFIAPAYVTLPIWFLIELVLSAFEGDQGGVANSAHVAGFVFGLAVALLLRTTGIEQRLREHIGSDAFDFDDPLDTAGPPALAEDANLSAMPSHSLPPAPRLSRPPELDADISIPLTGHSSPAGGNDLGSASVALPTSAAIESTLAQLLVAGDDAAMRTHGSQLLEQLAATCTNEPQRVANMLQRILAAHADTVPLSDRALATGVRFRCSDQQARHCIGSDACAYPTAPT